MTEEQNARAELKERFFDFLEALEGKEATLQLYEKNTLSVKFLAMQANGNHYMVENLKTPTGVMDHAVLRTGDTMFISFPLYEEDEKNAMK